MRSRVGGAAAQDWPGPERNQSVPVLSGIHRLVLWREALLCAGWGRGHSQCAKAQSRGICAGGAVWRLRPEEGEGGRIGEGKEEREGGRERREKEGGVWEGEEGELRAKNQQGLGAAGRT